MAFFNQQEIDKRPWWQKAIDVVVPGQQYRGDANLTRNDQGSLIPISDVPQQQKITSGTISQGTPSFVEKTTKAVNQYFKPVETVRARDIVREVFTPNTIVQVGEMAKGVAKSAGETVLDLGRIGEKYIGSAPETLGTTLGKTGFTDFGTNFKKNFKAEFNSPTSAEQLKSQIESSYPNFFKATNDSQKIGKITEQVMEVVAPFKAIKGVEVFSGVEKLSKIQSLLTKVPQGASYVYAWWYQANKGEDVKQAGQDILNTDYGRKLSNFVGDNTSHIGTNIRAMIKSGDISGDSYLQVRDELLRQKADPNSSVINRFLTQTLDTTIQTALGVIISAIPGVGKPLAATYWTSLSADEQVKEKGQVYSLGNIGIDVVGDMMLSNVIEGVFKKPLVSTGGGLIATIKDIVKGMHQAGLVEGITEPTQDLLKYANDYIGAKTPEEKKIVLDEAVRYIKSGDIIMTGAISYVSGAVIGGGANTINAIKGGGSGDDQKAVEDAIEKAKIEAGIVPDVVTQAVQEASQDVIPASEIQPESQPIYHFTSADIEQIKDTGFNMGGNSIFGNAAFFTDAQQQADTYGDQNISLDTKDFSFRTFNSPQEMQSFVTAQGVKNLAEAIRKEGRFDGAIITNGNPEVGNTFVITNKTKLDTLLRSQQMITTEEAKEMVKSFPFIKELNLPVEIHNRILTQQGQEAFGYYSRPMVAFINNPHKTTIPHEAMHAFVDLMVSPEEKVTILDEVKRRYAGEKLTNKQAEERLSQDFGKYYANKFLNKETKAPSSKLKQFFEWLSDRLKQIFSGKNVDILDKLYKDIETKKPALKQKKVAQQKLLLGREALYQVQKEYAGSPDGLTAKFLLNPNIVNREYAPKQFIEQILKGAGLKAHEESIIRDVLNSSQFEGQDKISIQDFRDAVKGELLALDVINSDTYADYGSRNLDYDSYNYDFKTHIYNSKFLHGNTGHFSGNFDVTLTKDDLEIVQIPTTSKWAVIRKGVQLTEDNVESNTFTVSESKEGAEAWVNNNVNIVTRKVGLFGHTRVWDEIDNTKRKIKSTQEDIVTRKQNIDRLAGLIPDLTKDITYIKENTDIVAKEFTKLYKEKISIVDSEERKQEHKIYTGRLNDLSGIDYSKSKNQELKTFMDMYEGSFFLKDGKFDADATINHMDNRLSDLKEQMASNQEALKEHETILEKQKAEPVLNEPRTRYIAEIQSDIFQKDSLAKAIKYSDVAIKQKEDNIKLYQDSIVEAKSYIVEQEQSVKEYDKFIKVLQGKAFQKEGVNRDNYIEKKSEFADGRFNITEKRPPIDEGDTESNGDFAFWNYLTYGHFNEDGSLDIPNLVSEMEKYRDGVLKENISKAEAKIKEMSIHITTLEREKQTIVSERATHPQEFKQESSFVAYKNIWHERMIKEEIRLAALDGFKAIRFPTPYTISMIEGYIGGDNDDYMPYEIINATDHDTLESGDTIDYGGDTYTVVKADGYNITVAPSDKVNSFMDSEAREEDAKAMWEDAKYNFDQLEKSFGKMTVNKANNILKLDSDLTTYSDRFFADQTIKEINDKVKESGVVPTEYEDKKMDAAMELIAKYPNIKDARPSANQLKSEIAKNAIDNIESGHPFHGLIGEASSILEEIADMDSQEKIDMDSIEENWKQKYAENYEPDYESMYDEVYFEERGYDTKVWTVEGNTEDFQQPDQYTFNEEINAEDFNYEEQLSDDGQKTVNRFYDKQVKGYLEKIRKGNLTPVTDDNGYTWLETEIKPEDNADVIAFQTKDDVFGENSDVTIPDKMEKYRGIDSHFDMVLNNKNIPDAEKRYILEMMYADRYIDPMTGVFNHKFITDNGWFSSDDNIIISGDVDDVKGMNKKYGHDNINQVIQQAAIAQKDNGFIVARGSGGADEFYIFLGSKADLTAQQINDTVASLNKAREEFTGFKYSFSDKIKPTMTFGIGTSKKVMVKVGKEMVEKIDSDVVLMDKKDQGQRNKVHVGKEINSLLGMTFNETKQQYSNKDVYKADVTKIISQPDQPDQQDLEPTPTKQNNRTAKKSILDNIVGRDNLITASEMSLLNNQIRTLRRGVEMGMADMREILTNAFKQKIQNQNDVKEAVMAYAEQLPVEERGQLIPTILNAKTDTNLRNAFERIDNILTRLDKSYELADIQKNIRKIQDAMKSGKGIAVDYQKKIMDIIAGYDLTRPTENTIRKLQSLREWLAGQPMQPYYIPGEEEPVMLPFASKRLTDSIERLTKKNPSQMSFEEIRGLNNTINELVNLGKLKLKLKNRSDERTRQENLTKLIGSTNSLDPKGNRNNEKVKNKIDSKMLYFDTLHTFRVFDSMDGNIGYKGENVKLQRNIANRFMESELETAETISGALEEMRKIKDDWNEQEQATIMFYLMLEQNDRADQAQSIIDKMGWKAIPEKTESIQKAIDILRKTVDRYDDIAPVYEEINNKPLAREHNYFPTKYENEDPGMPEPTIGRKVFSTKKTSQGFTFGRKKNVLRTVRTDVFSVWEEAVKEQIYYKNIQPELIDTAALVGSKEYQSHAGRIASNYWKKFIDVMANRGQQSGVKSNRWLRRQRIKLSQAVLGYKLSSVAMQPLAIFDALSYTYQNYGAIASTRLLAHFGATWVNPWYSKRVVAQSKALKLRKGGELSMEEIANTSRGQGALNWFKRSSMYFIQAFDIKTAASVDQAIFKILKGRGVEVKEAREEADMIMQIVSGSSDIPDRPMVLTEGEAYRTLLTFQTFALNRWGLIMHDILGSGLKKGGVRRKFRALIALMIIGFGSAVEKYLRRQILAFVSGKKVAKEDKKLKVEDAVWAVPESIPILGNIIQGAREYGSGSLSIPLARPFESAANGAMQVQSKKADTRMKGYIKLGEAVLTINGVPGSSQLGDIVERLLTKPTSSASSKSTSSSATQPASPVKLPKVPTPKIKIPGMKK